MANSPGWNDLMNDDTGYSDNQDLVPTDEDDAPLSNTPWDRISINQKRAVELLGSCQVEDIHLTHDEIAKQIGCGINTLKLWRKQIDFQEALKSYKAREFKTESTVLLTNDLMMRLENPSDPKRKLTERDRMLIADISGLTSVDITTNTQINIAVTDSRLKGVWTVKGRSAASGGTGASPTRSRQAYAPKLVAESPKPAKPRKALPKPSVP